MTSSEIRNSFLKYFEQHGHTIVSSSPVVPYDDPTLLFANAGMNQFKDVFLNTGKRTYTRAADTQKCIRVSGKHNDLEEVGRDTYHHTFFEMLGNWSFGDYYKKEAITWAWELLTKVWELPKNRLWATVYKDDSEAEQLWKTVTDIDPSHVLRFGEKDNFWEMGETGPCGPCSEIHIDQTPTGNATADMVNAGIPEVMEIWNLVFIQYNRDEAGKLTPLPAKHVDTGMGFERICAVLQNEKSNYDTDVFTPIIEAIENLADKTYSRTLPSDSRSTKTDIDTAIRVIADHTRMLSFAIADGASPSNEGRGSALKQVLKRAIHFGNTLNLHEPFIYKIVDAVVTTMGDAYPELIQNQAHIKRTIQTAEERFSETKENRLGLDYFYRNVVGEPIRQALIKNGTINRNWWVNERMSNGNTIVFVSPDAQKVEKHIGEELQHLNITSVSGEDAFKLYATFGVHIDDTEGLARDIGIAVDKTKFEMLMEEHKKPSRSAGLTSYLKEFGVKEEDIEKDDGLLESKFVGYDKFDVESKILGYGSDRVCIATTTFYPESGGQVGDSGIIEGDKFRFVVKDTKRDGDIIWHFGEPKEDYKFESIRRLEVNAAVDKERRLSIMRNHSATHLLHNALRRILGTHVKQAGSLVAPDYFRFDFSHFAKVTDEELQQIETLVNEKIRENIPRTQGLNNIPFEDAKKLGALMFFGDKYGERVNVIQFGDFSTEFCGGTHVNNTGEIGYFKIRSESSVASGVRRIEGVTHNYALELLKIQDTSYFERLDYALKQFDETVQLKSKLADVSNGKSDLAHNSLNGYEQRLNDLKQITSIPKEASQELTACFDQVKSRNQILEELILQIADTKKSIEKELGHFRLQSLSGSMDELIASAQTVKGIKVVASQVTASSMDELKAFGDSLRSKLGSGIGLLATVIEDKLQLVCVVTDDLVQAKKAEAGKIVGAVAKLLGGSGGGRPHMATAGGKDVAKLDEAISQTKSIVESLLRN